MESGLFLVGAALLAISVSGGAQRGAAGGGEVAVAAAAAAPEGDGLFLLRDLLQVSFGSVLFLLTRRRFGLLTQAELLMPTAELDLVYGSFLLFFCFASRDILVVVSNTSGPPEVAKR